MSDCKYLYKGKWYTENELRNHPDFVNAAANLERDFINGNTGPKASTNLFAPPVSTYPGVTIGYYTKFIDLKKQTLVKYKQRLHEVNQKRNSKLVTSKELAELNKLKRQLEVEIEGEPALNKVGLEDEIADLEKNANVAAVGYYVENDLDRLKVLANSDSIDDLNEAKRLIEFYKAAGTFQKDAHNPFFTEDDMFVPDANGKLTSTYALSDETIAQFREWAAKAEDLNNPIIQKFKDITKNTIVGSEAYRRTYAPGKGPQSFEDLTYDSTGLQDTAWFDMWTMDITQGIFTKNGAIPQMMFSHLSDMIADKRDWVKTTQERTDALTPKVIEELRKLKHTLKNAGIVGLDAVTFQLFKEVTKDGFETGGVIQKFNKEFYDAQSKAQYIFNTEFKAAVALGDSSKIKSAFNNLRNWRRNNTIVLEVSKIPALMNDPEFVNVITVKGTQAEADAYEKKMIALLGKKEYDNQVEAQAKSIRKYIYDRQYNLESLMVSDNVTDPAHLSQKSRYAMSHWELVNNPMAGVEDYYGVAYGNNSSGLNLNYGNSYMNYNVLVPRKFTPTITKNSAQDRYIFEDSTTPTGHHNETFSKFIEGNQTLSEFHDLLIEVMEVVRDTAPYEIRSKMAVNTFPALAKSSAEIFTDKADQTSTLMRLFQAFRDLYEKVRMTFGVTEQSQVSYADINVVTGKANYRVNDQFLRGNYQAVKERSKIEKTKFMLAYGPSLKTIHRHTTLPIARMSESALVLLNEYLNAGLSMQDIKAKNLKAITDKTGMNVPVGRIIQNFALHSVVQSQSFDLPKLVKHFSSMAMLYAARNEALPVLEIMKNHYDSIKAPKTTNLQKGVFNLKIGKAESTGLRDRGKMQMEDWFGRGVLANYDTKKHYGKYGKKLYSREDQKKLDEVQDLLSRVKDKDQIAALEEIKAGLGKTKTATAAIENLLAWVRTLRLGYSFSSAITNLVEGFSSNMLIAATGEDFDSNEIYYGYHVAKASFIKNASFGYWEPGESKKNRTLMDLFEVIMDSKNELQKASVHTFSDKFERLNPHTLNQRVEFINQSAIMIAMLRTKKIKGINGEESSVWNAYTPEGKLKAEFRTPENIEDWERLKGKEYKDFKVKLSEVIVKAHGNYDQLRGMMLKSNTAGKAMMMFKTWIPQQLYWRFATEQDNLLSGKTGFKGRYWSFTKGSAALYGGIIGLSAFGPLLGLAGIGAGYALASKWGASTSDAGVGLLMETAISGKVLVKKMLGMPVNAIAGRKIIGTSGQEFDKWAKPNSKFTQQDANALKANMSDLAMQLMFFGMMLMVKKIFWDDDDKADDPDRIAHNILVNRLMQLSTQGGMYINPSDIYKSTIGSNAVIQYYDDVMKEGDKLVKYFNGEDIIQSGIHAGESGLWNQTRKTFLPGMFKDGLDVTLGFKGQAERQIQASAWDRYFKSDAKKDQEANKRERAAMRRELEEHLDLNLYDGGTEEEKEKARDKDIRKRVDTEAPTPAKLKKLGVTREEYEKAQE